MREIAVVEHTLLLIEGNAEAVEQVLSVRVGEVTGVIEAQAVGLGVGVVLDGLNNVAETLLSEALLGEDSMDVRALNIDVREGTLVDIARVDGVLIDALVVGNGPGRRGHDASEMVSLGVDRGEGRVLRREGTSAAAEECRSYNNKMNRGQPSSSLFSLHDFHFVLWHLPLKI